MTSIFRSPKENSAGLVILTLVGIMLLMSRLAWAQNVPEVNMQPLQVWGVGMVGAVRFSPDGTKAIVVGSNLIQVFDTSTNQRLSWFTCYQPILSVDGTKTLENDHSGTVRIFDTLTGSLVRTTTLKDTNRVDLLSITPDSSRILGSYGAMVYVWDAVSGDKLSTFTKHTDSVFRGDLSPDGTRAATGSYQENVVQLWDTKNGNLLATLAGHRDDAEYIAFTSDGSKILTGGAWDDTARVWDASSGSQLAVITCSGPVWAVALSPDGTTLIVNTMDNIAEVWDISTSNRLALIPGNRERSCVAFSPDGKQALTGSSMPGIPVRLWDTGSWNKICEIGLNLPPIESLTLSPDGTKLFIGYQNYGYTDLIASLLDLVDGKILFSINVDWLNDEIRIFHADFTPDGKRILTVSNAVRFRDAVTGDVLTTFTTATARYAHGAVLSPDGTRVVLTDAQDHAACLWDTVTGDLLTTYTAGGTNIKEMAFTPDGSKVLLISGLPGVRPIMRLLDQASGDVTTTFTLSQTVSDDPVDGPVFSPDGSKMLTHDQGAWLWDTTTGEIIRNVFTPRVCMVSSTAFSPDGSKIICTDEGSIEMFTTMLNTPIQSYQGHTEHVRSAVFIPDGTKFLSGSWDGTIRLWAVPILRNGIPPQSWNIYK